MKKQVACAICGSTPRAGSMCDPCIILSTYSRLYPTSARKILAMIKDSPKKPVVKTAAKPAVKTPKEKKHGKESKRQPSRRVR